MRKHKVIVSMILLAVIIFSCSKVPITNRKQLKLLPESIMLSMALTSYQEFLTQNPPAAATEKNTIMVKSVGGKLKTAVVDLMKEKGFSKRIQNYKWDFNLVNSATVNAWCMPGGKVVVYSGILDYTKDETGLAVVMSHEIAHAVARHGNERMSQQMVILMGGIGLSVAMQQQPEKTKNIFLMSYGVGSVLGTLAYSRQHEYEADKLGMVFMAYAGYDPSKSIEFWERMSKLTGGATVPQFLSTHPSDENRIKACKEFLPTAMKYYKAGTTTSAK
ncbi:MAG TPA: M48 family metallopeptidase [Bacteroidales bacterium]|nr:M48 family metallopeptidase [Bacteroidales bacterium]HPS17363.1 M48 family metallopeptidase [Bacteroidales bacterium]